MIIYNIPFLRLTNAVMSLLVLSRGGDNCLLPGKPLIVCLLQVIHKLVFIPYRTPRNRTGQQQVNDINFNLISAGIPDRKTVVTDDTLIPFF